MKTHVSKTIVVLLQRASTDPVHPTICYAPRSPVAGCVIGVVSTWLQQCDPCWSAWSWVEQISVSPECRSTAHILREDARSCNATTAWSPLAAGATAYWIQDCCACLPVSSWIAPAYVFSQLQSVKDLPSRQRLRSSSSHFLLVATSRLSTVGDRAFPVAAARVWNILSRGVISASSLPAFKRRLKTELFLRSFPEVAATASD